MPQERGEVKPQSAPPTAPGQMTTDRPDQGGREGFDQYHEPAAELSAETRTFARMIASLTEEAEAIGWYQQRISVEPDKEARAIMENAQQEEFKHFAMDLEFLTRRTEKWRIALKTTLFTTVHRRGWREG